MEAPCLDDCLEMGMSVLSIPWSGAERQAGSSVRRRACRS